MAATVRETIVELGKALEVTEYGREATSGELAVALGIPDSPGHPVTRALIVEAIRKLGIPIGANERGFFLIKTEPELASVVQDLEARADAIRARAAAVVWAFGVRHPQLRPIAPLEAYE